MMDHREETGPDLSVLALREAAERARWNIYHREGGTDLDYERHWRATAAWLEKRAAAIERGDNPDADRFAANLAEMTDGVISRWRPARPALDVLAADD